MYHIVEILSSTRSKVVRNMEDLDLAKQWAYQHSFRTGLAVEIQTEFGKIIDYIIAWRD